MVICFNYILALRQNIFKELCSIYIKIQIIFILFWKVCFPFPVQTDGNVASLA